MMLTELLKLETAELHTAIEGTCLAKRIVSATIKISEYLTLLRRLLYVHQEFEERIELIDQLSNIWKSYMTRSLDIICDLVYFGEYASALPFATAHSWSEEIFKSTWAPLGAIYVFEGSRLGSFYLTDRLAAALQVQAKLGNGLDYHLRHREHRYILWNEFRNAVNSLPLANEAQLEVVTGARQTFSMLIAVYNDSNFSKPDEGGDAVAELAMGRVEP